MGLLISSLCSGLRLALQRLMRRANTQGPQESANHPSSSAPFPSHRSAGCRTASYSSRSPPPSSVSDLPAHLTPNHSSRSSVLRSLGSITLSQSISTSHPLSGEVLSPLLWDSGNLSSENTAKGISPVSSLEELAPKVEYSAKSILPRPTPSPPVLSSELLALGDEALSTLETLRPQLDLSVWPELPEDQHRRLLQALLDDELEKYFSAAIDAKNALQLRKAATTVDIGEVLQALLPYLGIHTRDSTVLCTVIEEIRLIEDECTRRGLQLNFYALESLRSLFPPYRQSLLEKHNLLFSSVGAIIEEKDGANLAANQFMSDPSALRDQRLPRSRTGKVASNW